MISLVLLLLTQTDPRYLGGAAPHAMNEVGPVDERPSVHSCTVETLRSRTGCMLEGRPPAATDRAAQARANVTLARETGEALCRLHAATAPDGEATLRGCFKRIEIASKVCALEGAEALLDAEGDFSRRAQRCYSELAAATQLSLVPADEARETDHPVPAQRKPMPGAKEML